MTVLLSQHRPVAETISADVKTAAIMTEPEVVTNKGEQAEGSTVKLQHTGLNSASPTGTSSTKHTEETEPVPINEDQWKGLGDPSDQSGAMISGFSSIAESFDEFLAKAKAVIPKVHNSVINQNSDSLVLNESWSHPGNKTSKRDKILHKMSAGRRRSKGKEQSSMAKEGLHTQSQSEKNTNQSWEHLEATKAIFDLLKEISGLSLFFITT